MIILSISGKQSELLYNEAGGHRIQRVPPTEKRGRIHTSTVTVAVSQEADIPTENSFSRRSASDFRIEYFSGSGAGGQHRNKHMNSVRLIHIPTGIKQECQGRKRLDNLKTAETLMLSKLDEHLYAEVKNVSDNTRKEQIGSGMRGDKRRTYRFQDDTVVDHITNKQCKLSKVMKGGFVKIWP